MVPFDEIIRWYSLFIFSGSSPKTISIACKISAFLHSHSRAYQNNNHEIEKLKMFKTFTRWAPTSYNRSYNHPYTWPCKLITGVSYNPYKWSYSPPKNITDFLRPPKKNKPPPWVPTSDFGDLQDSNGHLQKSFWSWPRSTFESSLRIGHWQGWDWAESIVFCRMKKWRCFFLGGGVC